MTQVYILSKGLSPQGGYVVCLQPRSVREKGLGAGIWKAPGCSVTMEHLCLLLSWFTCFSLFLITDFRSGGGKPKLYLQTMKIKGCHLSWDPGWVCVWVCVCVSVCVKERESDGLGNTCKMPWALELLRQHKFRANIPFVDSCWPISSRASAHARHRDTCLVNIDTNDTL